MKLMHALWHKLFVPHKSAQSAKSAHASEAPRFLRSRSADAITTPVDFGPDYGFAHTDFDGFGQVVLGEGGVSVDGASLAQTPADSGGVSGPLAMRRIVSQRDRYTAALNNQSVSYALVYVSRATSSENPHDQLRELRKTCLKANARAGISSAIVFQDGMFCQWLQGSQIAVEACFVRIKRDPRHAAMMVLFSGNTSVAMLDPWCMGLRSLYMAQGAAFKRAQRLRVDAKNAADTDPFGAWIKFTGSLVCDPAYPVLDANGQPSDPGGFNTAERMVCLVATRSAIGAGLLADATREEHLRLVLTRWAAADDADCDLQVVVASLLVDKQRTNVIAVSARSLRVGIVREVVRRAQHWVLLLRDDDMAELDQLLDNITDNTPADLRPPRITVAAPAWRKETQDHAVQLLTARGWQANIITLRHGERGSWRSLSPRLV
jgi:hypothetical protein